jgi:RNA polymerase sigma factor (TIGR02999 family)
MNSVQSIVEWHSSGKAAQELLPAVYEDLRKLAAHRMARLPPGETLQATALVHEAWIRLVNSGEQDWQNRAYCFAAASEAMRQVLVDNIRRKTRLKRGGGQQRVGLDEIELASAAADEKVLLIHEAVVYVSCFSSPLMMLQSTRYWSREQS